MVILDTNSFGTIILHFSRWIVVLLVRAWCRRLLRWVRISNFTALSIGSYLVVLLRRRIHWRLHSWLNLVHICNIICNVLSIGILHHTRLSIGILLVLVWHGCSAWRLLVLLLRHRCIARLLWSLLTSSDLLLFERCFHTKSSLLLLLELESTSRSKVISFNKTSSEM